MIALSPISVAAQGQKCANIGDTFTVRGSIPSADINGGLYFVKAVDLYAVGHPAPPAQVPQWKAAILWFSGKTEDARKAFSKYIAFR